MACWVNQSSVFCDTRSVARHGPNLQPMKHDVVLSVLLFGLVFSAVRCQASSCTIALKSISLSTRSSAQGSASISCSPPTQLTIAASLEQFSHSWTGGEPWSLPPAICTINMRCRPACNPRDTHDLRIACCLQSDTPSPHDPDISA